MTRILSGFMAGVLASAIAAPAVAQTPPAAPQTQAAPQKKMDPKYVYQVVGFRTTTSGVATGTVLEIDKAARKVKLKGDGVTTPSFKAHPKVQNFEQLTVEDEVTVEYFRSATFFARNPRTPPRAPEVAAAFQAGAGTYQGAEALEVAATGTATVQAIDKATNTVTFKGPEGALYPMKVEDPALLNGVTVGQEFDVDVVEATALAVAVKPKPPPPVVTQRAKIVEKRIEISETVLFATDKADIDPRSYALLDDVASIMKGNPQVKKVRVEGNASKDPKSAKMKNGAEYNLKLSAARAAKVKEYLVSKGVDASRLDSIGFGWNNPVDTNATPAGRAKNRRVDFMIVDQ
jgi:outer membrane protein OmpA-like peptidoglycan-associated protein